MTKINKTNIKQKVKELLINKESYIYLISQELDNYVNGYDISYSEDIEKISNKKSILRYRIMGKDIEVHLELVKIDERLNNVYKVIEVK